MLMLAAFLATLPVYAPNHLLFETGAFEATTYMTPFANTLLGGSAALGALAVWVSSRPGGRGRLLEFGWVASGSACYIGGYVLFVLASALPGFGSGAVASVSGALLAAGTVELAVAWGASLVRYDLRQALLWVALMVGIAGLLELLLSSVAFAIGVMVFCMLLPPACFLPCWEARRGKLAREVGSFVADQPLGSAVTGEEGTAEGLSLPLRALLRRRMGGVGSLVAMPFAGLLVFAFLMGTRKFILFDVVHMEVLGCVLGALVVVPLCFVRSSRPLLPVIYRLVMPAFACALIFLNSFPPGTVPIWFAAWLSYVFFGMLAILALASLVALVHGGELSPGTVFGGAVVGFSACSLAGVACATTPPFQVEGGGPALLVVSTLFFVLLIGDALWGLWRASRAMVVEGDVVDDDGFDGLVAVTGTFRGAASPRPLDVGARCEALADGGGLTPREREILGYLGRGHGIAFIAGTLVISESTVRTHVKAIYRKLDVNSREELLTRVGE